MSFSTFRRCHFCATTLEQKQAVADKQITQCDGCGKHFAPFYFFKNSDLPVYSDNALRPISAVPVMWGFATTWGESANG